MKRGHKIFIIITLVLLAFAFIIGRTDRYGPDVFDGDTIALLRVETRFAILWKTAGSRGWSCA